MGVVINVFLCMHAERCVQVHLLTHANINQHGYIQKLVIKNVYLRAYIIYAYVTEVLRRLVLPVYVPHAR